MFTDLINMLKHSLIQSHYYHTTTQSYSEHKALDDYYDNISSHIDALIESYQGTYDTLIKDYNILPLILDDNVLGYFKTLRDTIKINKYKYSFTNNHSNHVTYLFANVTMNLTH